MSFSELPGGAHKPDDLVPASVMSPAQPEPSRRYHVSDFFFIFLAQFFFQALLFQLFTSAGLIEPPAKRVAPATRRLAATLSKTTKRSSTRSKALSKRSPSGRRAARSADAHPVARRVATRTEAGLAERTTPAAKVERRVATRTAPSTSAKQAKPAAQPAPPKKAKASETKATTLAGAVAQTGTVAKTKTGAVAKSKKVRPKKPKAPPMSRSMMIAIMSITLLSGLMGLALVLLIGRMRRMTWPEMGWQAAPGKQWLKWSLIFFPSVLGFTVLYNLFLQQGLGMDAPQQQVADFLKGSHGFVVQALMMAVVVFGAPITEEALYRGVLFQGLRKSCSLHVAAILSGLFFGAIHIEFGRIVPGAGWSQLWPLLSVVPPLALLGYILAIAYERSRSIWVPIMLHLGNNALAYLMLFLF